MSVAVLKVAEKILNWVYQMGEGDSERDYTVYFGSHHLFKDWH